MKESEMPIISEESRKGSQQNRFWLSDQFMDRTITIYCIEFNKPVPDQCLKYFECDHGICTVRCCNKGDRFSKFDLVCITVDACREQDCCLKSIPTTTTPVSTTTTPLTSHEGVTTVWRFETVDIHFSCDNNDNKWLGPSHFDIQETITACTVATLVMNTFVILSNMTLACLLYDKLSGNSRKMMMKFQDMKVLLRLNFKLLFQIHSNQLVVSLQGFFEKLNQWIFNLSFSGWLLTIIKQWFYLNWSLISIIKQTSTKYITRWSSLDASRNLLENQMGTRMRQYSAGENTFSVPFS